MREAVKSIEILSPAKNLEYGKEVIKSGADAIYIGAPKHSMRIGFTNSIQDIKELIDFAHKYWVKVYVTLNSLLYTNEDIEQAKTLINEIYNINADGIIIQDLGILEFDLPPIPIIISVSTMCSTKEDAKFLQDCGVSKIVLSRQLSYSDIKDIAENTTVPLEMFCYGFYCVGKDGNCYMAYLENLLKTNSNEFARYHASNYGFCPERCMRNWTLFDYEGNKIRENDRLLNLRYLNLYEEMENLVKTGVESFKIAGREKDLKHAKNSTALFSERANSIANKLGIKRSSSGHTILGFKPSWEKNFNKGFSNMFYSKRKKEMYSKYDLTGQIVGKVINFKDNSFKLESDIKLSIGDKLRYKKDEKSTVKTIEIIAADNDLYTINPISDDISGLILYRYVDVKAFEEVEKSVNYRVISVSLEFNKTSVTAIDEDNNKIELNFEKGVNKLQNVQNALYSLDVDCEFVIDKIYSNEEIYIDNIDRFKNILFEKLREERAKNRPVSYGSIQKNNVKYYQDKINYLKNVNNSYSKAFYERHGVKEIEAGLETSFDVKNKRILNSKYCLRYELGFCEKYNKVDNKSIPPLPWKIKQLENGITYDIEFNCKNCEMNFYYDKKEEVK